MRRKNRESITILKGEIESLRRNMNLLDQMRSDQIYALCYWLGVMLQLKKRDMNQWEVVDNDL
jgi:hypothetical protein